MAMSLDTQRVSNIHINGNKATESEDVPTTLALFARGVWAMLTIWSALRISIEHWRDDPEAEFEDTAEGKKQRLCEEIVDAFFSCKDSRVPQSDELENFLVEFIGTEFNIELEDGSEKSIVSNLNKLWLECNGDTTQQPLQAEGSLLQKFEAMAAKVSGTKASARQHDADESSSSEDDGDNDDSDDGDDKMEVSEHNNRSEQQEPVVDEDGFELVQRRRR